MEQLATSWTEYIPWTYVTIKPPSQLYLLTFDACAASVISKFFQYGFPGSSRALCLLDSGTG